MRTAMTVTSSTTTGQRAQADGSGFMLVQIGLSSFKVGKTARKQIRSSATASRSVPRSTASGKSAATGGGTTTRGSGSTPSSG